MATIAELAQHAGLQFEGDGSLEVSRVQALALAQRGDLTFVTSTSMVAEALASPAVALVAPPDAELPGKTVIRSPVPYLTVVELIPLLHPRRVPPAGIDPRAIVGEDTSIDASAIIHPAAVIADGAEIGPRTEIMPCAYIGEGAVVGSDCIIHPNVTLGWGCRVGDRVIIHAGSTIGSDGYGYLQHDDRHVKIPHLGNVVIEDDVEIGANNGIDRGTFGSTILHRGVKTDNLVHVAHNVEVGEHSLLLGQIGIAGSSKLGHHVIMGGQSGVVGHVTTADRITVGPRALITRSGGKAGESYYGFPARPHRAWQRALALVNKLDALFEKVDRLLGKKRRPRK